MNNRPPVLPDFSDNTTLFLIAGPCAVESEQLLMDTAGVLRELCDELSLPLIFKSSYDKANRTTATNGRGMGLESGLSALAAVRDAYSLPVITDVHLPQQAAAAAAAVDMLQIPAFLCRQTDLLSACAATGLPMNIKKGQFLAPDDMQYVVEKAKDAGCRQILVCERGASFGYHNLVADMRSLVWLRETGCPIVFDATHSAQLPGGGIGQSGGVREMVAPLARAACAVGVNGIFVETHPEPEKAISDSATQWPLKNMRALLETLLKIHQAVQQ